MPRKGTRPGQGHYRCTGCGYQVSLVADEEMLPVCPQCYNTYDMKNRSGR